MTEASVKYKLRLSTEVVVFYRYITVSALPTCCRRAAEAEGGKQNRRERLRNLCGMKRMASTMRTDETRSEVVIYRR